MRTTSALAALGGISVTVAQTYSLTDTYQGSNFFSKMAFYTGPDPWVLRSYVYMGSY